jgi:uncharacterized protein YukE
MAQIIVNPRDQRAFAQELDQIVSAIREKERRLDQGMQELKGTWADERYRRFSVAVKAASDQLRVFYSTSAHYAQFLRDKAAAAERYLGGA